jgi:pyridoxine kinase
VARIVALSSLVTYGHVGLRAMVPALERLGHEVFALPTVVLSSHAAYPQVAGTPMSRATLEQMAEALEANGWLASVDMVITGYLPTQPHVAFAASLVHRIRRQSPAMTFVCDPVLGDHPGGLYLPAETAAAVRDDLLPLARIATPNAFELAWLSNQPVASIETAVTAARSLPPATVLATSIPAPAARLATLLVDGDAAEFTSVPLRPKAPSGTGDLLTALFAGSCAIGQNKSAALASASAWLEQCLAASIVGGDLCLSPLYGTPPTPFDLFTA